MINVYLAVDFGGGSGRVMAGSITGDRLMLKEIYRFPNRQIKLGNHIYWDFLALFEEMKTGLKKAVQAGYKIAGIAVDTWGVDFGLIDKDGNLVGNPVCYRDPRTDGLPDEVFSFINEVEHYADTGIQVMPINTLFQLYSLRKTNSKQLEIADKLLFIPDLFSYFLTGEAANEYCIASTSELLNAREGDWSHKLIGQLGLPTSIFGKIIKPGTIRGQLKKEIAEEIGLDYPVDVIAVGSHDTASAVIAVPSLTKDAAFLSSGTWSLLGIEVDEPILTEEARLGGFTNEGGVNNKIRFLQNITGLWILQRLMAEWKARGEECDFDSLIEAASQSHCRTIIPVDDISFQNPSSMEEAVIRYCEAHHLYIPQTPGEFMRCVTESLAYRYKQGVDQMNKCLPAPIKHLHIIGGGCQNRLLNQLTADYLGIPVQAGPVEATAMGNILVQALAKKEIFSIRELKDIVINSVILQTYYPSS